jgi:hypothetical protein
LGATGPAGATGPDGATGVQGIQGATGAVANPFTDVFQVTNATSSTSKTNGAVVINGGLGVGGDFWVTDIHANDVYANTVYATTNVATYADLAEKYVTDQTYPTGTVMTVGGSAEITAVTDHNCYVAGVISEKPAYLMNSESEGQAIALRGRVPVLVNLPVKKGDALWPCPVGQGATVNNGREPFAIALEDGGPGLVECMIR